MLKYFTSLLCCCLFATLSVGQVYVDEFDNGDAAFMGGSGTYSFAEMDGELSVTASSPAPFDVFTYGFHDQATGDAVTVDATGNNKVFVRAKASNVGVSLRMDLQDANGFVTSQAGITKILTTDYQILEFDFTGLYTDGGFGGTSCDSGPCTVDGTMLTNLVFFTEPGVGGFSGTVVIDYIAFGEEPDGVIVSDVFQDHFESDSSITSFVSTATYDLEIDGSELIITGDGTNPMWDPLAYLIRNQNTYEPIDIDITGNNKLFLKVKSTVPNTTIRFDVIDIDGFANTQGSITKLIGTDYSILEFDFSGTYQDLGYGGTPCTDLTAPCPVDGTRVSQLNIFIEPGVGEFLGEITIDYLSFDIPLEPAGPPADLIYQDHFDNDLLEFTSEPAGFLITEMDSELMIDGDGSAEPYTAVSYIMHDKGTGEPLTLDLTPAQNKVYVRARTESGTVPLRVDLIDTLGFITNQAALTKIVSDEYETFEYNFTGNYFDGGFDPNGPCTAGPCDVDPTIVRQMLIYPDAVQGGYDGKIFIDFVSIGQPAIDTTDGGGGGDGPLGVLDYSDDMDDQTALFVEDETGYTSTFANSIWTITADGSTGAYQPITYTLHDQSGDLVIANVAGGDNKLYLRARASEAVNLRVDLQDNMDFVTNANAQTVDLTTEFVVYELDYTGAYNDGGFGGTPCDAGPCPVDGQRIGFVQLFANDATGGFSGTIEIDWLSFGSEIVEVTEPTLLNNLTAFPNPVQNELTLELETVVSGTVEVAIFNAVGQQVATEQLGRSNAGRFVRSVDASNLPAGLYSASVLVDGVSAGFVKFVKY